MPAAEVVLHLHEAVPTMTRRKELLIMLAAVAGIALTLVLVLYEPKPRWCTPDKAGVAALEAEVYRYVSTAHWRDMSAPLIDEDHVRAGLLSECG